MLRRKIVLWVFYGEAGDFNYQRPRIFKIHLQRIEEKQRIQSPEIVVVFPEFGAIFLFRYRRFRCAETEALFGAREKATPNSVTKN
jgi:hypothetical protein